MGYSMMGFGATGNCAGAADAGKRLKLAQEAAKVAADKVAQLKAKIARLEPIVEDQKGWFSSGSTTKEQVDLFNAEQQLEDAENERSRTTVAAARLQREFIDFQAAGCFEARASPPVRTGTTTVEPRGGSVELPPVEIVVPKKTVAGGGGGGGGYSASKCPPQPARTQEGQRGQAVFCWQKFLISKGFDLGPSGADGDHGARTEAASKMLEGAAPAAPSGGTAEKPVEKKTISKAGMLPKTIGGVPTMYALAGFGFLAVAGAIYYQRAAEAGAEEE
jgi:hypothetical protein